MLRNQDKVDDVRREATSTRALRIWACLSGLINALLLVSVAYHRSRILNGPGTLLFTIPGYLFLLVALFMRSNSRACIFAIVAGILFLVMPWGDFGLFYFSLPVGAIMSVWPGTFMASYYLGDTLGDYSQFALLLFAPLVTFVTAILLIKKHLPHPTPNDDSNRSEGTLLISESSIITFTDEEGDPMNKARSKETRMLASWIDDLHELLGMLPVFLVGFAVCLAIFAGFAAFGFCMIILEHYTFDTDHIVFVQHGTLPPLKQWPLLYLQCFGVTILVFSHFGLLALFSNALPLEGLDDGKIIINLLLWLASFTVIVTLSIAGVALVRHGMKFIGWNILVFACFDLLLPFIGWSYSLLDDLVTKW